jgi:sec-independent protein translocase protein TatC
MYRNFNQFKFLNLELKTEKIIINEVFNLEHLQEAWQRSLQTIFIFLLLIIICFIEMKQIIQILELPIVNVKFFQNYPGEYFVSTLKIATYTGFLFSIPLIVSQIIYFLLPGLTNNEKIYIVGLVISSNILFILGLIFSFFLLIPAALKFFITYSFEIIEPLWSFEQYISFILLLFLSAGVIFQIPIFQVLLSLINILNGRNMLSCWKYIIVLSTILSAILTPSADPITQILLASAIFFLYLLGSFSSIWLKMYII